MSVAVAKQHIFFPFGCCNVEFVIAKQQAFFPFGCYKADFVTTKPPLICVASKVMLLLQSGTRCSNKCAHYSDKILQLKLSKYTSDHNDNLIHAECSCSN